MYWSQPTSVSYVLRAAGFPGASEGLAHTNITFDIVARVLVISIMLVHWSVPTVEAVYCCAIYL